ncbi:MAG TPA: PEGA domain-containing protein [Vicinamibacterales bacterium]|nr:PEGA domain-containing protein [Vicinamibacterales bacterium]
MLHQIGVGALGPVFRTYDPARDRLVAVKVFRLEIVPEQAQALADELNRASQAGLFHPSIVEPVTAGVEGTVAYRAEEYVAAESLDIAMRHYASAGLDTALPFLAQLAGAIDFARSAGVGHGGLHPRDVFVTPDEARATGFGVVEALERVGIRAPVRRPYSAPERIAGEPWSTPADVFALAAIAFEMLTGRRPAGTGAQIGPMADAHLGGHADAIWAVLARGMDDEAARRYPSALALASALESAARGEIDPSVMATVPVAAPAAAEAVAAAKGDVAALAPTADVPPDAEAPPQTDVVADAEHAGTLFDVSPAADAALASAAAPDVFSEMPEDLEQHIQPEIAKPPDRADTVQPAPAVFDVAQAGAGFDFEDSALASFGDTPLPDAPARAHAGVLPIAVTLILGLLVGFGAGYFEGHRDRTVPASAAAADASMPPDATTADGAGVTQHAPSPSPATAAPPAVPDRAAPTARATAPETVPPPATTRGRLVVQSTPMRAAVTVNGRWRGRTPLTLESLALGHYVVRVVEDGYRVERQEFTLSPREAEHVMTVHLQKVSAPAATERRSPARSAPAVAPERQFTGSLFVDSRPQGARVMLDGTIVGHTPLVLSSVRIGAHVVRLELDEHHPWSAATTIVAGQETRVTGSLERFR